MNHLSTSCAILLCAVLPRMAVSAPPTHEYRVYKATSDTVVTATRTPRQRRETLAPTTVLDRNDIERLQVHSFTQLLRRVPGVSISRNGGRGKLTSVFLRGAESDQVLVLVDGVRVGSATAGLTAFQDIPVDDIERVEVVRGPRSSLYGSEAIGGVIQIFTRQGGGDKLTRPYFSVSAGRYDTYEAHAGLSGGTKRGNYNISLGGIRTSGFDSCRGRAPDPVTFAGGGGCFVDDQPDNDGYNRISGSLRGGYLFQNGLKLEGHFLQTDASNQFDGSVTDASDTLQQVLGLTASLRPTEMWDVALSIGQSRDESNDFLNDSFVSEFNTKRYSASLQNDVALASDHLLTFGLDYYDDNVDSTTRFQETKRDNAGAFIQYLGKVGRHQLQLALRGDDNEQFGKQGTGSATYGWSFIRGYKVTVSYGTAYKAPTFNELYFPGFSNPNLDPEESSTVDVGLIGQRAWGQWSLNLYQTKVDDLIALDSAFVPQNISQVRIRGAEAGLGTTLRKWQINTNLTWLDAENRANNANRGNDLPRRPDYIVQLDIDRAIRQFSFGASLHYSGRAYDDAANTRRLDAYTLVDLRGEMKVAQDWRIQARIANLFSEDYETAAFFNQPGRSLIVTLRYQPK